ncbi:MAG: response regulator transcription factor [Bacteroidia bacterium]
MSVKVLLAEHNYLVREGLKTLMNASNGLECIGIAENAAELELALKNGATPEVVIIDHLHDDFGISAVKFIRKHAPSAFILSITVKPNKKVLSEALAAGVTSYLMRDCGRDEIIDAIHTTASGEQFLCGQIVSHVMSTPDEVSAEQEYSCDGVKISSREAEIIRYVAEGLTNKEIADKLYLSAHTVTTHRKNIMAKLGINNTAGLVLYAIRNNIVTPNHFLFNTN